MITLRKLATLKKGTLTRKAAMIFHENSLKETYPREYLVSVLGMVEGNDVTDRWKEKVDTLPYDRIMMDDIYYHLLSLAGSEPSDWDMVDEEGNLDASKRTVLEHYVVLDRVRSPFNIGSIFRSADSFGIKKIYLIEGCGDISHPRCAKTSRGCTSTVDWEYISEDEAMELVSSFEHSFALELGGVNINTYEFPDKGICVIGSEEFGVSPRMLSCCRDRLTIPMAGSKGSLNVSVSSGIMFQRWF